MVRAKFKCMELVQKYQYTDQHGDDVVQPTVTLRPVYAGGGASEEDKAFWDATPNGELHMTITNTAAVETFEIGKDYYLTFEPVESYSPPAD